MKTSLMSARAGAAITALLLATVAACSKEETPPQAVPPTVSTQVSESAEPSASPSVEPSPSTQAPPSGPRYPTDAKGYAQALLSAWANRNTVRLKELATQATVQQIADNGHPNSQWTYINCEGGSGTAQCTFRNAHGDEVKIALDGIQLGQPNAATEALLERTQYPDAAGDYVSTFIYAWKAGNKQRMARLSNNTITGQLAGSTPPSAFNTFTEQAGNIWTVTIEPIGGGEVIKLKVDAGKLGSAGAITGIG